MGRMVSDTVKLPKLTPFGRDEVVLDAFPFAVSKDDWSGHDDSKGTSIFSSLHSDGVLGLGLSELSTRAKHPKSFVGRLMAAGAIDAPQFFLSFARHDNGEPSSSSLCSHLPQPSRSCFLMRTLSKDGAVVTFGFIIRIQTQYTRSRPSRRIVRFSCNIYRAKPERRANGFLNSSVCSASVRGGWSWLWSLCFSSQLWEDFYSPAAKLN